MSYNNDKAAYPQGSTVGPVPSGYTSPQPQYQSYNPPAQQYPDHNQTQFSGQQQYGQAQQGYPSPQPQAVQHQPSYSQQPQQQQMTMDKGHAQQGGAHADGQEWKNGFCDCFSDFGGCCLTCWCPCITYGKIQHRLRNNDMSGYSACNGACWGFCALASCCGFQWILSMSQRGEIRHKFGVKGSGCGDCMRHYCCECCALIQEDKETKERKTLLPQSTGYQQQAGMQYGQH